MSTGSDIHRTIDAVWKLESARIIAGLTRLVRDVGTAEGLAQDALVAALEKWPGSGVPDNPGAWLMTTAKRRAVDHIRRAQRLERKQEELAHELREGSEAAPDDVLRLMFLSCHPALRTQERVALTLRLVGGLSAAEIARAFLLTEADVTQRVAAAKHTLAEEQARFALPAPPDLADRLSSVLEVVYLIFNEGYAATEGDDLLRPGLCLEAQRLGRMLADLMPQQAEVHGLVALMDLQSSRTAARTGPDGEPVPLHEQNRGRWDRLLIRRGFTALLRAREIGGTPGPYVLQAAIAACHAQAASAEETDWAQIAALYEVLVALVPTPVVQLNQAVAVGRARGANDGLAIVDALTADPALRDYHLLPSVRGDLLYRLGRDAEARVEFERAAALTANAREREFLLRRAAGLATVEIAGPDLGSAAEVFLARTDLDTETRRSYGQTLRRLCRAHGAGRPLSSLTPELVAKIFDIAWGSAAAATWNRHRSAIRSFSTWLDLDDLAAQIDRRTDKPRIVRPLTAPQLASLWALPGVALRERSLWRMLHESAAGVTSVLALDVQDLDIDDRRARARGGGWIQWRAETARLLPPLLAGRASGPLFLADRKAAPSQQANRENICPETGRRRLSYPRAEYLFKQATKPLDPNGVGYTLRQLKPVTQGSRPDRQVPGGAKRSK